MHIMRYYQLLLETVHAPLLLAAYPLKERWFSNQMNFVISSVTDIPASFTCPGSKLRWFLSCSQLPAYAGDGAWGCMQIGASILTAGCRRPPSR
jgi:hypothetical protein